VTVAGEDDGADAPPLAGAAASPRPGGLGLVATAVGAEGRPTAAPAGLLCHRDQVEETPRRPPPGRNGDGGRAALMSPSPEGQPRADVGGDVLEGRAAHDVLRTATGATRTARSLAGERSVACRRPHHVSDSRRDRRCARCTRARSGGRRGRSCAGSSWSAARGHRAGSRRRRGSSRRSRDVARGHAAMRRRRGIDGSSARRRRRGGRW
jgi:hypothetical protein